VALQRTCPLKAGSGSQEPDSMEGPCGAKSVPSCVDRVPAPPRRNELAEEPWETRVVLLWSAEMGLATGGCRLSRVASCYRRGPLLVVAWRR
jgi:hypothetical protein